jgi:hypothetical protein
VTRRRHDSWSDEPTVVQRTPTDAELMAAIPEFAHAARSQRVYSLADYRADLETTQHDLPALPDTADEPSWGQVIRMGVRDVLMEVLP